MPSYSEHLSQAKSNLKFLEKINKDNLSFWDWKVTVCFYSALHLINAHINRKTGLSYESYEDVANAINPFQILPLSRLSESEYTAYITLQNLSRRSRYLLNETNKRDDTACLTTERHYVKALKNLQTIISYFEIEYQESIPAINVYCPVHAESFTHFRNT